MQKQHLTSLGPSDESNILLVLHSYSEGRRTSCPQDVIAFMIWNLSYKGGGTWGSSAWGNPRAPSST